MVAQSAESKTRSSQPSWLRNLAQFEKPDTKRAIWQLINTFVPYIALWAIMVWIVRTGISYWYAVPCVVLAGGLLVRIFIFFHDCCHGSFFPSRNVNRFVGYICGVLTFTPFEDWRHHHAGHHATSGDLHRRGVGDVWTLTVAEYLAAPKRTRILYRIFRNPLVFLVIGPPLMFLIGHRFTNSSQKKRERDSVALTNLFILAIVAISIWTMGLHTYLLIQVPTMVVASCIGVWLFYVQHQFEKDYWAWHEDWDPIKAALDGSSYYKLPAVLQWLTGNIGLHHIHHLRPKIPNYNLQRCLDTIPELREVEPLTFFGSLHCLWMNLWDEQQQKMVSFRAMKRSLAAGAYGQR